MKIEIDAADVEDLARVYEDGTTELAGITIDIRRRLGGDLLDRTAAYGLPTRGLAYECEHVCGALATNIAELERFTLEVERVWAEASGFAREGRLIGGPTPGTPDLWWFRGASGGEGAGSESYAFSDAEAAGNLAPSVPVPAVDADAALAPSAGAVHLPATAAGTWEELDRYLLSMGVAVNRPPEIWQTTGGVHSAKSRHYRGQARDYSAGMDCDERGIVAALRPFIGSGIVELFHAATNTWYPSNVGAHRDHVHAAIAPGFQFPS